MRSRGYASTPLGSQSCPRTRCCRAWASVRCRPRAKQSGAGCIVGRHQGGHRACGHARGALGWCRMLVVHLHLPATIGQRPRHGLPEPNPRPPRRRSQGAARRLLAAGAGAASAARTPPAAGRAGCPGLGTLASRVHSRPTSRTGLRRQAQCVGNVQQRSGLAAACQGLEPPAVPGPAVAGSQDVVGAQPQLAQHLQWRTPRTG